MNIFDKIKQFLSDIFCSFYSEARTIVRDEGVVLFMLFVPLFYPILYSWIYNNEVVREVPVAVVDASHSALSREFVRRYDASPDVKVAYFCNSIEEARRLVAKQEVNGIVYLPEDLSKRLNRMEQTTVSVYCDMSLMLAYKAIFTAATSVSSLMNANLQVALAPGYTDHENSITTQPLNYEEVAMFNSTGGYGNFILPGVLMLIIQQTLLLGTGLLYGSRRERGFFITTSTQPILKRRLPMLRIITGRTLCMLLIYAAVTAYVLLAIPKMFHFVQLLHPADLVLFVLPYLLACIFFAMTIGMLIPQREDVMLLVVFTSVGLLFLSGVSWPQSNIPSFWRAFACLFPSTFGIQGFVKLNTMGALISDIVYECRMLWIQALIYFLLALWLLHRACKKKYY